MTVSFLWNFFASGCSGLLTRAWIEFRKLGLGLFEFGLLGFDFGLDWGNGVVGGVMEESEPESAREPGSESESAEEEDAA